jgi:putative Holliday junction resolvase
MARILALDFGERRIGVAVSDLLSMLARPLTVIVRGSRESDFDTLSDLVKEYAVERIVVGLPLSLDGSEGPQARQTRRYTERLADRLAIPVEFWDERYSSASAADILRRKGRRRRRPLREEIDAAAAAVILQSYLDAQSSLSEN